MIKVSDYIFSYLESIGVTTVFTLTGGGIMHLVDSLGHSNMEYICCHHEQAAAIAAQAYDMYQEQLSVCLVTTGPGGTNALTGAAAAYVDSTPVIFMSGQVKREDFACLRRVRQFGSQENNIISMAKPVTKYAVLVEEAENIAYELEKCVYYATHGRKGPVWIDIPLDIQAARVEECDLRHFAPDKECDGSDLGQAAKRTLQILGESKRPVLLVGQGMVSAKAQELTHQFVEQTGIPVLATWRALDFMGSEEEGFFGSPGLQAPRYSNLILQHADVMLVLGSRMDNMITAFNEEHFAYRAKKIVVDIDAAEIKKLSMLWVMPVVADVKLFMETLINEAKCQNFLSDYSSWMGKCQKLKKEFPIFAEKQDKEEGVNLYHVTEEISKYAAAEDTIVISSTSRCNTAGHIAFHHKRGQKTISSMGMGSMGFALPSAVGAYFANGKKRVIVIEGDGSFQLNIQELETIRVNNIDAKIFIFNNNGYAAITTMQDRNFGSFYVGSNEKSGLHMPDLEKIASAYGIAYLKIEDGLEIKEKIKIAMSKEGALICDIKGSLWFEEIPKCISFVDEKSGKRVSAYLENPYPYLTDRKLKAIEKDILE